MRVMVFVNATADSGMGGPPPTEMLEAMGKFNEEPVNAGVMLIADGPKRSSHGRTVAFDGPPPTRSVRSADFIRRARAYSSSPHCSRRDRAHWPRNSGDRTAAAARAGH